VGARPAIAPAAEAGRREPAPGPSDHPRRYPLGATDRRALARDADPLREMEHSVRPRPSVAQARPLATYHRRTRAGSRSCHLGLSSRIGEGESLYASAGVRCHKGTPRQRGDTSLQRSATRQGLAPATVNNHLASLSAFTTWVQAQAPDSCHRRGMRAISTLWRHQC
jgi:hypothetical protein